MKLFFSAGEPSGDLHTASLLDSLRARRLDADFCGFGGPHMERAGCRLIFPLANYPIIGFTAVVAALGRVLKLISEADRFFRHHRPDAVVLVDNPGFNWWIARRAKFHGIPVFYFLPPQVWAWATWRVNKMRRFVDHVLCSLPFEADWYAERGVRATFTGHPYFDELGAHQLDTAFLAEYATADESPVIGILPGSRTSEVTHNFPVQLRAAERIARVFPRARFPVACTRPDHLRFVQDRAQGSRLHVRPYVGRTPEIIYASRACLAKSGSVSLELLYHTKPSTILYQISRTDYTTYRFLRFRLGLMAARYITLVNIMADREVMPEFVSCSEVSEPLSRHILDWLEVPAAHARIVSELAKLKSRVVQPGASDRTAEYILRELGVNTPARAAA